MRGLFTAYMQLDRKERMIYGIAMAAMAVMFSGGLADMLRDRDAQSAVQFTMGAIAVLLVSDYYLHKNYRRFVYSGIIVVIAGYELLLYLDHFVLRSYLVLIIIPLVIFFILPLRQALAASITHYLVMAAVSYYGYSVLHMHSAMFEKDALQIYLLGGVFILAFGSFYQLAIEESYAKLQHANSQKALLLKEIHHRIKNNLNKMSSALGLQILRAKNGHCEDAEEILHKNKLRIEAMALVHEALYRSEDISNISVREYISKLVKLINRSYERRIVTTIDAERVPLPFDMFLRIGTILNELYTNTIKHTPEQNTDIAVKIDFRQTDDICLLRYTQTGHKNRIDSSTLTQSKGLGMILVKLSAEEMGGKLEIQSQDGELIFSVRFKCEEPK